MTHKVFKLVECTPEEAKDQPCVLLWSLLADGMLKSDGTFARPDFSRHIQGGSVSVFNLDKLIEQHLTKA